MLEKSFALSFFLRKPKNYKSGPFHVYLRITVDGVPKEISVKREWELSRWNTQTGRAAGTKEDARTLNHFLESLTVKVHEARRQLFESHKEISAQAIKNAMMGVDDRKLILKAFEDHNKQFASLVPHQYSKGTLDLFKRTLDHTRNFIRWKYNVEDLDIRSLDYEFISEFSFWLKGVKKCQHYTTVKYLTYFKKIVLLSVKYGWLAKDPFTGFKLTKKELEKPYLTEQELNVITQKKFGSERLSLVRDIFLFSCFTGLAYADVQKLKSSEIIVGFDGQPWIVTCRQKTDSPSRIPLLKQSLIILDRYKDHPVCMNKGTVLPVLSNQKMNAYLKEIADVCNLDKNLTFHVARHTFATSVTLSNGVPIESVAKMLGHKNLRQTQHYAKVIDVKLSRDMQNLNSKLNT